jgi:hypothetical protein
MIDRGLQRAARKSGRDSTTTRVDLEFAICACPSHTCHAFTSPRRRAAKRSSTSCGSDSPPQPRSNSRIPVDIDSSSAPRPGRGAPCLAPVGRTLPPTVRTPLPITAWSVRRGRKSPLRGRFTRSREAASSGQENAPSGGFLVRHSTDLRLRDCHSGSHQPQKLGSRCRRDTTR